ncbi:MAG TPA: penicillin acylase family protein, partial [Terriglobales bacterium]
ANQRMIPENFPYKVGFEWAEPFRANRITEVLSGDAAAGHKITPDDMERLQADVTSLPARQLLRLLPAAVPDSGDADAQLLRRWNAVVDRNSGAAALYELWQGELEEQMLHRLAPENSWQALHGHVPLTVILSHLENPDAATFGVNPVAGRNELLRDTLHVAAGHLKALQGPDPTAWSWGRLHTVTFHHVLELLPGGKSLFDLGPLPRPGDSFTVNAAYYTGRSFEQLSGPSYREIIDVGNWDNSLVVNVPGESGQPGSTHYSDLLPLWDQAQYFPMLYSRGAVEKQAQDRLTLEPAIP